MLAKRGRLVRNSARRGRGDTISSSKGLLSRQCLARDSISSPARSRSPRRCNLAQSQGQDGLADFGEHRLADEYMWVGAGLYQLVRLGEL